MFELKFCPSAPPSLTRSIITLLDIKINVIESKDPKENHEPYLVVPNKGAISTDNCVSKFLLRTFKPDFYFSSDPYLTTEVDQWLDFLKSCSTPDFGLELINLHLSDRTYLVGNSLSLADIAVFLHVQSKIDALASIPHTNLARWLNLVRTRNPTISLKSTEVTKAESSKSKPVVTKGKTSSSKKDNKQEDGNSNAGKEKDKNSAAEDGGACPPLEGAVEGQVDDIPIPRYGMPYFLYPGVHSISAGTLRLSPHRYNAVPSLHLFMFHGPPEMACKLYYT